MKRICGIALAVLALFGSSLAVAPLPGITLIGKGFVAGTALDKSGLTGNICQAGNPANCVPKAIFGGFGSALTYSGHNNVFVAAPDRGPFDGLTDVPYLDRIHFLKITTDLGAPFPNIHTSLLDTRLLKNERGQPFVGAAGAFVLNGAGKLNERATLRFDPEGIRVGLFGTLFISDEYGPNIFEFGPFGNLIRRLRIPDKYAIAHPSAEPTPELQNNTSGRQANRGMEGLAISPNDRFLYGIMQNALIQDHGLTPALDRLGVNNRILKIDLLTGRKSEYVYVLDAINRGQGTCEILAINDHEFLVIERDNRSNLQTPPQAPTRKTIYKIDITSATDIADLEDPLPAGALPPSITPVQKTLFIDLLDPAFNLAPTIAEKIEGLAWGPDLPDGRHVLYVVSDNDLNTSLDTQLYAFAIERSVIDLNRQFLPLPIYPPWLVPQD